MKRASILLILSVLFLPFLNAAGDGQAKRDYSKEKVLFVTATSHLDTQWRWTIIDTITKYIPATLHDNFKLIEQFPDYVFSFEGAFRYMLMKEYYPEEYEKLKTYINTGRWAVCGSWVDAVDTHIQSPESLIRQTLYGNGFFKKEFSKSSVDIFLPDCFGFGYVLPAVAAHCGLKGFSSQKLTWGSAIGIPFDLGLWEGIDGSSIISALNPDDYVATIRADIRENEKWIKTIQKQGESTNLFVGYKYFGVGDEGGAPDAESVSWLEKSINSDGIFKVLSAPADLLFREIWDKRATLPRYKGELLMTTHGTGCYTSETAMKKWNRQNERMAESAEHASVIADWLGSLPYQTEKIRNAWIRFLWHGFHDDLTGTSIPQAYTYSWNDEIISMNMFDSIIKNAVGGAVRALDTRTFGIPIVVYNPLAVPRTDVVQAELLLGGAPAMEFTLLDDRNKQVPLQVIKGTDNPNAIKVVFPAKVPSLGFAVFSLMPGAEKKSKSATTTEAAAETDVLEISNDFYTVKVDGNGDICSIFDKRTGKETLAAPVRLELLADYSTVWPAWEIIYKDIQAAPRAFVSAGTGHTSAKIVEQGPVRKTIEIVRDESGSKFTQRVILYSGASGDRIEIENEIDWKAKGTLLKASFPLTAKNEKAAYDLGMGVIERGNNNEKKYEVPAQRWADITSSDGTFGTAVISDCKYGWDKPADNILRLTLIHTPETRGSYRDQATQDIGIHKFRYAIAPHKGDWRAGDIPAIADRMNQPLVAFTVVKHAGNLGKRFSFLQLKGEGIAVKALKKAEDGEAIIVRVQEQFGKPVKTAELIFASTIISAVETNGQEETVGETNISSGKLIFDIGANSPKTFKVTLQKAAALQYPPASLPVKIDYDLDAVSMDANKKDGNLDGKGTTFPGELFPQTIFNDGIEFKLGEVGNGQNNVLVCKGQTVALPRGDFNRLYILASAVGGDQTGVISVDGKKFELNVQGFDGFIGQWDSRVIDGEVQNDIEQIVPAYIKRDKLAFVSTHLHASDGTNLPYSFGYVYEYTFDIRWNPKKLVLPKNENIRIFAITLARNPNMAAESLQNLYDSADGVGIKIKVSERLFLDSSTAELTPSVGGGEIRYTLDGSEPNKDSALYSSPIIVKDTTMIKAKVYRIGNDSENKTISIILTKAVLSEPVKPEAVEQGLEFDYFEGKWRETKDMLASAVVKSGLSADYAIDKADKKEMFGFRFKGYIKLEKDGIYKFYLRSDDGSVLSIDGVKVVDNDGLHSAESEESGAVGLKAGLHNFELLYFDRGWDKSLNLSYSGPGAAKQAVNPAMIYRNIPKPVIVQDPQNDEE